MSIAPDAVCHQAVKSGVGVTTIPKAEGLECVTVLLIAAYIELPKMLTTTERIPHTAWPLICLGFHNL